MEIDQASATVLAALIAAIPATVAAWRRPQSTQTGSAPPVSPSTTHDCAPAETNSTIATSSRPTARRPPSFRALFFIIWGQLDIVAGQFIDAGAGPLSAWSLSFVGQGLVMLLIGFWLLLRD
ncbi:MAG: hypothetical protein ROZ37_15965 [Aromatoleum sp.]|jgi:hypothetical protein|uniref:hypothetical protein n=1 Tax=Aromatoleum sp. TaxID=2307007 RepID=UPI0028938C8D|nr:hypothetical protein [Aromatoleum sp.]MDT3671813.1 hypothetical protein [Aromatoleum sp.]